MRDTDKGDAALYYRPPDAACPFIAALGLFGMCYLRLGISILPMIVPYTITPWGADAPANPKPS